MMLAGHPVHRFVVKVLLWLPICFALWYWLANLWLLPIHWAMDGLFVKLLPSVISGVEAHDRVFEVVTRLSVPQSQGYAAGGILTFEIRPLVYAYSLPLYAALTLAAPAASKARKALYLVAGLLALLPIIAWGTSFDILKYLAFTLSSETAPYIALTGIKQLFIGWAYQFGYLILPGVTPLVIWIALHREFLQELAPGITAQAKITEQSGS
jgi:hypothetical protein